MAVQKLLSAMKQKVRKSWGTLASPETRTVADKGRSVQSSLAVDERPHFHPPFLEPVMKPNMTAMRANMLLRLAPDSSEVRRHAMV